MRGLAPGRIEDAARGRAIDIEVWGEAIMRDIVYVGPNALECVRGGPTNLLHPT